MLATHMPCHPTCITSSSLQPPEREKLICSRNANNFLDSFTYCELDSGCAAALVAPGVSACRKMTTLMIAVAAMTVGAAVGFLFARLIYGTASSVQRRPTRRVNPIGRAAGATGFLNSNLKIHGCGDW